MPPQNLRDVRVAVIAADGFEQSELDEPVKALREAGAAVDILAPDESHLTLRGVHHLDPAKGVRADKALAQASPEDYDALYIPGGLPSPDAMRQSQAHLDFVKAFMAAGKPVAAMCHGPWVLADAEVLRGRRVTSWKGIERDLERAGADWVDEPVVRDGNLATSRKPEDLPRFAPALVEHFARARAETPRAAS